MFRRTKIIATLGPATRPARTVEALVDAGMDAARLNCAHETAASLQSRVRAVRRAARKAGRAVATLALLALAARGRWTALLCAVPALWLALSALTLFTMGVWQGWAVLAALLAGLGACAVRRPSTWPNSLDPPRPGCHYPRENGMRAGDG